MTSTLFPGMDPYLEEPTRSFGVHTRLITIIADTLAPLVAPQFTVAIEERVYIASPDDSVVYGAIRPDVHIVRNAPDVQLGTATLVITPPTMIMALDDEQIHERFLEVRDTRTRAVVTTIEILSPANKAPNTEGRRQFIQKRQHIMESQTHWIEIDLLRGGERPPEARGRGDYYALLRRADDPFYALWSIGLRDRLPVIAVPTIPSNADVPLDLQAVVDTLIQRGMYRQTIDYDEPVPAPALRSDDAVWVREQIAGGRA